MEWLRLLSKLILGANRTGALSQGSKDASKYQFELDKKWVNDTFARREMFLDRLKKSYENHKRIVDKDDEMWNGLLIGGSAPEYHLVHYMYGGRCAIKLMIMALIANDCDPPAKILDFPSGHGRVARFLSAAFPEAELWAGDVNKSGLEFCAREFAAKPLLSDKNLKNVRIQEKFDLIWCGSLATHLGQESVVDLMDLMTGSLNDNGLLGITTCGRGAVWAQNNIFKFIAQNRFEAAQRQLACSGFGYIDYPGVQGYGMTWISPEWMFNYIKSREDLLMVSFHEKAWHGSQDVYFIIKRPLSSWYNWDHD